MPPAQLLSFGVILRLSLTISLGGGLLSCDDIPESTQAGIEWLRYSYVMPVETGWKLENISATSRGIEISFAVNNIIQIASFERLSAMNKGEVARLACPLSESKFWTMAGTKMTLNVRLKNNESTLVSAICRRP